MTTLGLTVRYLTLAAAPRALPTTAFGYVVLDGDCVVGRAPEKSSAILDGVRPVRIDGMTGGMSRVHMAIRHVDDQVLVVDVGSRNGVLLREPAARSWTRLTPWRPAVWHHG